MAIATRLKPSEIFTDAEWHDLMKPSYWVGPLMVLHGWAVIVAMVAVVAMLPNIITYILAVMVIGSRQLGVAILMHEAAHNALHPSRRVNNFLGQWFCAAPLGIDLAGYRAYHLQHHKHAQQEEDPDLTLTAHFPVSRQSLGRKFLRDLTGQTFLKQRTGLVLAGLGRIVPPIEDLAAVNGITDFKKVLRDMILTNFILFAGCWGAGVWWAYPALWLVPMATWLPFVTRVRNIAEHATLPVSDDPLAHARSTHATILERIFVAPYYVNWHAEHHAFMYMPCHRLPKAHKLLRAKGLAHRVAQSRSYRAVMREAIRVEYEAS